MPKSLLSSIISQKNALEQQHVWLELYDVLITPTLRLSLTNHTAAVIYQGREYLPYPIRRETIRDETTGRLQQVQVHISNAERAVQWYLEQYDGLRGRPVRVTWVLLQVDDAGNATDITAAFSQTYTIDSVTANESAATFTVGKVLPMAAMRLPGRLITRDLFPCLPLVA